MEFDFKIRHVEYTDKSDMLIKNSSGVVKCKKDFPIYGKGDEKEIFKPLSKTKPLTTPLFGISEVFWSTIINNFFDREAPIYKLAICNGYDKDYPSKYSKGTLVPSVLKSKEHLINLLEYYRMYPNDEVNIDSYVNYCGIYYDYTMILNSLPFQKNDALAKSLAHQILISILKCDVNFHYENVAFIASGDKIISLAPPIDHEFSIPFLYPDDDMMHAIYFGEYNMALMENAALESKVNLSAMLNNIAFIKKKYPKIADDFIDRLKEFIIEFSSTTFLIPKEYMEPLATDLYMVFEAIYKEHSNSKGFKDIPKFTLKSLDVGEYQEQLQREVLISATSLYKNLVKKR